MSMPERQRGVALFTVVFLIVVVGALGVTVALISGQQQLTSAQTLDQTRALYAARARLEREIASRLDGSGCPSLPAIKNDDVMGFRTELTVCEKTPDIREGGRDPYDIYRIGVRASRGSQSAGTLVQREVRAQVTNASQ
jgi:MSHA biogenesis protein MshP